MAVRILVIDDEPLLLTSIQRALSKVGYDVATARTREEFLEKVNEGDFQLIIMDLNIPHLRPEEIVQRAKQQWTEVKFLVISGVERLSGMPFIQKPFSIQTLRKKVQELLNGPDRD